MSSRRVRENSTFRVAAYNVSGEYAMVKSGGATCWLDEKRIVLEILTELSERARK